MPSGNEANHRFDGLTVEGGMALGAGAHPVYLNADANGQVYVNGTPLSVMSESQLMWPPPETDQPIELTISAAISTATGSNGTAFAVNGNGVVYGSSSSGSSGGGIVGVTLNLSSMGTGVTVNFEKSTDGGTNYVALTMTSVEDGATTATSTTTGGTARWFASVIGATHVRIRPASGSGTVTGSWHGNNCSGLLANQDYIIYCPVPIVTNYPVIGGVKFQGGRHVVWIGGEINVPLQNLSGSDTYSRAIYTDGCTGTFHMEGIYIHGVDLSDGFQLYSPEAIIQIQNCRVGNSDEPLTAHNLTTFADKHPDAIEGEGGWRELRVDKFTCWSNYQGIFLNQVKTKHGRFNVLRRCDLNGAVDGVPAGSKQLFQQGDDAGRTLLYEFYVQPHTEKTSSNFWQTLLTSCRYYGTTAETDVNKRSIVVSPAGLNNPTSGSSPTSSRWVETIRWPPKAAVFGLVRLGPPPTGEFVPLGKAGCAYVPLGYNHSDEARLFQEVGSPPLQGRAIRPSINKLKSWSMDPANAVASGAPPTSGQVYLIKMPIEETIYETTGFVINVDVAGTSLTNCFMGMYDRVGNKLAASADLSATFNSTGQKSITLTDVSPYTPMAQYLVGGYAEFFFAALLCNSTGNLPKFAAAYDPAGSDVDNNARALAFNMGVDGTGGGIGPTGKFVTRFIKYTTGNTSLPASIFFSTGKPSNFAPLLGFN